MQPVPEGYEPLGFAGFTDKGSYIASEVYAQNDIVHSNNAIWRCLINGTTGIVPEEGENWTIFIESRTDSAGITTTDTEGLLGSAGEKVSNQDLIDAIADRVINRLIAKSMMSGTQINDANKVPTSALVYAMQQSINQLNENLSQKANISQLPAAVAVKGNAENTYRTGNVNITPANIGLGNVNNTADANKNVKYATTAGSANAVAWGNVSSKPATFLPSTHTHDDRYYTEAEINNLLGKQTGTITAASGVTITEQYCIKRNNVVSFRVIVKATTKKTSWADLAYLPSGFRPNVSVGLANRHDGPNSWDYTVANLKPDGVLQMAGELAVNGTFMFFGTFVIN